MPKHTTETTETTKREASSSRWLEHLAPVERALEIPRDLRALLDAEGAPGALESGPQLPNDLRDLLERDD